jgi:hypothetical protein
MHYKYTITVLLLFIIAGCRYRNNIEGDIPVIPTNTCTKAVCWKTVRTV